MDIANVNFYLNFTEKQSALETDLNKFIVQQNPSFKTNLKNKQKWSYKSGGPCWAVHGDVAQLAEPVSYTHLTLPTRRTV